MIEELRRLAPTNEFDYPFMMSVLKGYKKPRDKITRLIRSGAVIRVKKGLYVFGAQYTVGPISKEVLANLIYGPSYISLEYALMFHGMIPESVKQVTSMTSKKNKTFSTPVGNFVYSYLHPEKYPVGIIQYEIDPLRHILIASREKAVSDLIARQGTFSDTDILFAHLTENLRIDEREIMGLNKRRLTAIEHIYRNRNVTLLKDIVRRG
ncbi:MAG: hypothetical protein SVY10_08695 [Thermodesulfobacteriota bacterium]|nr:hypothetical protein [Thermodesulfobacteriota bacterium]